MKALVALYQNIDSTNSSKQKIAYLVEYFRKTPPEDAIWTLYYFMGKKQKRLIKRSLLQDAALEATGLPPWLFEECYAVVGDLAETIALLSDQRGTSLEALPLREWIEVRLPALSKADPEQQKATLKAWWRHHSHADIFMITKLLTGGFRSGVSDRSVVKALAEALDISEARLTEKLMGDWPVTAAFYRSLLQTEDTGESLLPFPFFLASPLEGDTAMLGDPAAFACEWKWDGIRAQIVKRAGQVAIWSRGEELITASFPELQAMAGQLPDGTLLDGEILAYAGEAIQVFAFLQKRLQRKKISDKMLRDIPVLFLAFDCLQWQGVDLRDRPLHERRLILENVLSVFPNPQLRLSTLLTAPTWEALQGLQSESRARGVEGLMLKRWTSSYQAGRRRGDWWKWKIAPMTLDAVLLYAQPGHGKRATLYTDYTFAIWRDKQLVPFAKAYSGLSNEEIVELDAWIRKNTIERFGPVRSVKPERVFEIAFEGIGESTRHKSGLAVRFPRILRERLDKGIADADSLETAKELIHAPSPKSQSEDSGLERF